MKLVGGDGRELSWKFVAEGSTDSQHWFTYVALIRVGDKPLSMMTSCIKWKHFPRYWPFVWGIHRSPVNSPHKDQRRGALVFSLICAWINGWVNNRKASDLRRHPAYYDVTLMWTNDQTVHCRISPSPGRNYYPLIGGLMQERRNSSALAMELHLSCSNS